MQILSIHLKNIKSHRETELNFSAGINVLSGPNGVGKSTVFEAVGYALFGVDARDFVSNVDRFLTIGAKRGEIAVTFTPGDGDIYRVSRTVGTPSTWRLARENGGSFEVEDHANATETEERIRELLRLAKGRSLAEQFKQVIGPFQNDFLGPFVLKQTTKRRDAFDEILGIDSWRKTYDGTKQLGSVITAKMTNIQTEIAGKEERLACLPLRQEELQALVAEEAAKSEEFGAINAALAVLNEQLAALEEKRGAIDRIRAELAQVEQSLVSGKEYIASQLALVTESEAAERTVEEARPGKERYDAAEKMLHDLREREKGKRALEKEIVDLRALVAAARQGAEHEEREAAEGEKRIVGIRAEITAEETALRSAIEAVATAETVAQAEVDRLRKVERAFRNLPLVQVDSVAPYLRVTLNRLVELEQASKEKKELLASEREWQERAAALVPLRQEREAFLAEKSRLLGRKAGIAEGEEKLQEGVCPFLQEECRNLEGQSSLDLFTERKRHLDLQVEDIDAALVLLDGKIAAAEGAVKEMEGFRLLRHELERLEKERREREIEREKHVGALDCSGVAAGFISWANEHGMEECRTETEKLICGEFGGDPSAQLTVLERWEKSCQGGATSAARALETRVKVAEQAMAATRAEKVRVEAQDKELLRRKSDLADIEKRVSERRQVGAARRASAEKAEAELQGKETTLRAFDGVEASIQQAEEARRLSQPDQHRFLQAEPIASDLPNRREKLDRFRKRLADLELEWTAKGEMLRGMEKNYSAEQHAEERTRKEGLQTSAATLAESLKNIANNRRRLTDEISVLEKVREEIGKKQEEARALKRKEELVKFLRNKVFKNVSAQLSERFREEIGVRADRIYRTISEADEELIWGDDYRIVLRDMVNGEVRERTDDQLSGGQTMSAVVALRLALLQTIGARIAFFDEPTSNLDSARRENLAQAFRAIDHGKEEVTEHWYDQLFLISHDVAFTEVTDQVIPLGE